MKDQLKLFLRNKGVELSSFVVNAIIVTLGVLYGLTIVISLIILISFGDGVDYEPWMAFPFSVTGVSALGWGIYSLVNARAYQTSYWEVVKNGLLVLFGIFLIVISALFAVGLLMGGLALAGYLLTGYMKPEMVIPATAFQMSVIATVMYGIPKWLMLNWQQAKRGMKSSFNPLWNKW